EPRERQELAIAHHELEPELVADHSPCRVEVSLVGQPTEPEAGPQRAQQPHQLDDDAHCDESWGAEDRSDEEQEQPGSAANHGASVPLAPSSGGASTAARSPSMTASTVTPRSRRSRSSSTRCPRTASVTPFTSSGRTKSRPSR